MDTRFSMAIQMLVLIALSPKPMSSAEMAGSVGTNASHVRRILGQLKKAGLVSGRQGLSGFNLERPAEDISLLSIYCAVHQTDRFRTFDLHQNPNDACTVGRYIRPVLEEMFSSFEQGLQNEMQERSLADCIAVLKRRVAETEGSLV